MSPALWFYGIWLGAMGVSGAAGWWLSAVIRQWRDGHARDSSGGLVLDDGPYQEWEDAETEQWLADLSEQPWRESASEPPGCGGCGSAGELHQPGCPDDTDYLASTGELFLFHQQIALEDFKRELESWPEKVLASIWPEEASR